MKRKEKQKFIGVLSRFEKKDLEKNIAVLIILSGPEPNRTTLAKKLIGLFKNEQRNIVFVLGEIAATQKSWKRGNCTFYNYLLTTDLQEKINAAQIVLCRSGYSSILDLATLGKKAFFIPTKNQPEQEYLAFYLQEKNIAPYSNIEDFTIKKLLEVSQYTGFNSTKSELNSELFHLFHRK
jgi:UDP-N-acetylglucosamine:LPS N-acetylglucosamine transferase